MLHQLQVGQIGHWEFFGGHLDHSNETQTHCPHDCHSIMDAKYESAHTQRSVLTHGSTSNFRTLVPWLLPSPSVTALAFSSSAVLTTFNQIITPERPHAAFWISPPFSGFLSIATYIGRPWLIQWPPCPYYQDMDLSMQISSDWKKFCA